MTCTCTHHLCGGDTIGQDCPFCFSLPVGVQKILINPVLRDVKNCALFFCLYNRELGLDLNFGFETILDFIMWAV